MQTVVTVGAGAVEREDTRARLFPPSEFGLVIRVMIKYGNDLVNIEGIMSRFRRRCITDNTIIDAIDQALTECSHTLA